MLEPDPTEVDVLAQIIRKVDGQHGLGAGALAEAILTEQQRGRVVAREYARWHLGTPEWADIILSVFHCPDESLANLNTNRARYGDDPIELEG